MSTFKTVLVTTAVLLLGSVIFIGYSIVRSQQDQIVGLQTELAGVEEKVAELQITSDSNTARLNRTIKTANKNFTRLDDRQDKLYTALKILADILTGTGHESPNSYARGPNTNGE